MLIVISHSAILKGEATVINRLFDEGLELFHLRKPESNVKQLEHIMVDINPSYYNRIAFHSHHDYAQSIGMTRLHFSEADRRITEPYILRDLYDKGFHLSTSLHNPETLPTYFDYSFYGPVFDSISKPDYKASVNEDDPFINNSNTKLIALGGINESNCIKALQMGFQGIALCGAIWNSSEPLNTFKRIKEQCTPVAQ